MGVLALKSDGEVWKNPFLNNQKVPKFNEKRTWGLKVQNHGER